MPYTEIHPIKTTLYKAIDYISNLDKTENKANIHTRNCLLSTAGQAFNFTRKRFKCKDDILAFHIIQAFKYGEVTEEQALEITTETMERFLQGRYEYIVAVHNDKNHIHSHVIVNSVNRINGKSFSTEHDRKYNPAWKQIRKISDEIARENGISVIENPINTSRSHYEWEQYKSGTSWKEKLKRTIDNAVKSSDSFNDFLHKLQDENITVKYQDYKKKSGKCLGYKMDGQKYFVYTESFGRYYSIDNINRRIERCVSRRGKSSFQKRFDRIMNDDGKLKRMFDLSEFNGVALRKWAADENRKITIKTLSDMQSMGFKSAEDFFDFCSDAEKKLFELKNELNRIDRSITHFGNIEAEVYIYNKYKLNYDTYKNSSNPERYLRRHEKEILLFMQASEKLEKYGEIEPDKIVKQMETLKSERQGCIDKISELTGVLKKLDTLRYNLEIIYEKRPEMQPQQQELNESKTNRKKSKNDISLD